MSESDRQIQASFIILQCHSVSMIDSSSQIESINTMFKVVEALDDLHGAGITELADHLDMPKSTVHSHISTLLCNEFVVKHNDKYYVGMKFFEIGNRQRSRLKLYRIAHPHVRDLAIKSGELVGLAIEEHSYGVLLHIVKGENAIQYDMYSGLRTPLHATSTGKAILAHLPSDDISEIVELRGLDPITPHTITSQEELDLELESIREKGYSLHRGEHREGVFGVAVPIMNEEYEVLGSLGISGPMSRLQQQDIEEELIQPLKHIVNIIEVDLRYS